MKKLYVGNLSPKTKQTQVEALFADLGEIESLVMVRDHKRKKFKGFCFIEMEDEAALAAIEALNGKDIKGRALVVNEAEAQEEATGWRAGVARDDKSNNGGKNLRRGGKRGASDTTSDGRVSNSVLRSGNRTGGGDRS